METLRHVSAGAPGTATTAVTPHTSSTTATTTAPTRGDTRATPPAIFGLGDIEEQGIPLAPAGADRGDAEPAPVPVQLVHKGADDPAAGGADRMPEGDGAPV